MSALLDRLRSALAPTFRVDRELGRGGMGTVFLAHDSALDRPVAVKILSPENATARAAERFLREARLLGRLSHPNVVAVHQAGEADGLFYYVMDFVQGETLADRLARGPLRPRTALRVASDVLQGLGAAHRLGIVHRDIKPSNVFLLPDRALVSDFGIAKPTPEGSDELTDSGTAVGTQGYMAPEQAAGGPVGPPTDVYAVGVVLYEALTGRRWWGPAPVEGADWSGVPRRLRRVLRRALAWNPRDRWPSAQEFRRALQRPRPRITAPAAGLVLGAVAILGLRALVSPTGYELRGGVRADLAILPFDDADDGGKLGRELARYTADRLQWFPRWLLRPISLTMAWSDSVPPAQRPLRALRELNARSFVEGRIVPTPAGTHLDLTIRDSAGRALHLVPVRVPGSPEDLAAWSGAAADSIVARTFPQFIGPFRDLVRGGTGDVRAYESYFRGEDAFQQDAYEAAEQHYREALGRDPNFVAAALRLAIVRRFRRVPFEADLKRLYDEHGPALPEQHRLLIEALLEPNLEHRFGRYRRIVEAFPRDATVRFIYADELFHRGPLVGISLDTALAEMARVAELQPHLEQAPTYDHLLWGSIRLGRRDLADRYLRERMRIPFSGEAEESRRRQYLRLAYDARFRPSFARVRMLAFSLGPDSALLDGAQRYLRLGTAFDLPGTQLGLGRALATRGFTPLARANGHRAQGLALLSLGRSAAALAQLDSGIAAFGYRDSAVERAEWRVLPVSLGLPADPAGRAWGRARLTALARDPDLGARAAWALAIDAYAAGDTASARAWTGLVTRQGSTERGAARLALLLRAREAAARGALDSALAISAPLLAYDSTGLVEDPFARSVLHLSRADWHLRLGDTARGEVELLWYENSDSGIEGWVQRELQPGEVDAVLGTYARLLRARLASARRDPRTACLLGARVAELWSGADAEYAALAKEAGTLARGCRA